MSGTLVEGNAVEPDWTRPAPPGATYFSLIRDDPDPAGKHPRGILLTFNPVIARCEWIDGWEGRAFQMPEGPFIFSLEGEDPPVPPEFDAALRDSGPGTARRGI